MATVFSMAIVSSIVLIALYLPYKLLLSPLKQPVVNRVTLFAIYIVSILTWPLSRWITSTTGSRGTEIIIPAELDLSDVTIENIVPASGSGVSLADVFLLIYYIGIVSVLTVTIWSIVRLINQLRRSPKVIIDGAGVRVLDRADFSPFSLFGIIAIGREDIQDSRLIVAHERCHQRRLHSIDLIVAQLIAIFQWFNPAAWLMMRELKAVHEYDVDEQLIAQGINLKEYQYLLIKKAVGARFPSLANSLNHSNLKNRITMMQKSKDAGRRRWRLLALAPAMVVALGVTHLNGVASAINAAASSRLPQLSEGKVSENSIADQESVVEETLIASSTESVKVNDEKVESKSSSKSPDIVLYTAEKLPQFPGGEKALMQWINEHMSYPQEAMDKNEKGRVVVKFIINEQGKVVSPEILKGVSPVLDAEALRVVSELPTFEPGTVNGKPVSVNYALPINFSLKTKATVVSTVETKGDITEIKDGNVTIYVDGRQADSATLKQIKGSDVKTMEIIKNDPEHPDGKVSVVTNPALFVNGEAVAYEKLNEINPADIKSMEVIKNDTNYPQGKIMVTLK